MSLSKRECPHCHGSLERYEDPVAVKLIADKDRELEELKQVVKHPYKCPVCFDGIVEREHWEMLYGKNLGLQTCGSSPKHLTELKVWIGQQLDGISSHGCESCWSDSSGPCTCKSERETMKQSFLEELTERMKGKL